MTYFHVLVEGASDVPTMREILTRRFGLTDGQDFRIYAHQGRGRLPENINAQPDPRHRTLLHQLPAKLRSYATCGVDICVLVVVDADDTPPAELLGRLEAMVAGLSKRPERVLFRLAIEETESWFLADTQAVKKAYPKANLQKIAQIAPDSIVGAWERLAEALKIPVTSVTGATKGEWASQIAPHMDFDAPASPSLRMVIEGIAAQL